MKSFLKCFALILCFTFVFALLPADVSAADMTIEDKQYDGRIYKGGTFDVEIKTKNAIDPHYQWQYSTNGTNGWKDIFNGESRYGEFIGAYKPHLQLVTTTDMDFDPMEESLFLRCKVTGSNGTVVKYSRSFLVGINEYSKLETDLCVYSLGLGSGNWIKSFSGTNLTHLNEVGHFPVICSTEAGCPMTFYVNLQQLDEKFTNSEVELRVSVTATENDKSITRNGGTSEYSTKNKSFTYTPYTVSPGEYASLTMKVTVSPYINGVKVKSTSSPTRLDHTWNFNIIGKAPQTTAKGNVNYACSLLKEMYNESEKLTSFIKNEEVSLVKQVGSWWLVMADGYVGYLPVNAVTVQGSEPQLPAVNEIRIGGLDNAPQVGDACDTDLTINGGVTVNDIYWWRDTDGNGAADESYCKEFKEGGDYYLRIELAPQNGYRFPVTWEPGTHGGTHYYNGTIYVGSEKLTERVSCYSDGSGMVLQFWKQPALPADPVENPFTDVTESDYFFDPVMWAVKNGVTTGMTATTFGPESGCTRAHAVTFLWRAMGCPEPGSAAMPFKDVEKGSYYEKAVQWAVEEGITAGTSATTFSPDANCERGQIVTFLWRLAGEPAPSSMTMPFTDVEKGGYYEKAVLWAVEEGITNGMTPTTFGPTQQCTRGQIVTFLWRYIEN